MNRVVTVSIFGSCVTRDMLEFDKKEKQCIQLGEYIARQSIITANEGVVSEIGEINLDSAFQRRLVLNDMAKSTFIKLANQKSDYLVLDLIDERFRIGERRGTLVTLSNEMIKSRCINEEELRICNKSIFGNKAFLDEISLEFYVNRFLDALLQIYQSSQIILHKAYFLMQYRSLQNELKTFPIHSCNLIDRDNAWMDVMYSCIEKRIPKENIIDCCENYYAEESHRWGLAPMHYCDEYYLEALHWLYQKIGR